MSNTDIDISLIIVTWNVREHLRTNLRGLFSIPTQRRIEVIVIDNGSHDGTAWMVREEFPQVRLITNDWDAGFAGPCNQGLRIAKGRILILLNPDMLVTEGALDHTYETLMKDQTIGVMGITLLGNHNTPINSVRRDPDLWSQLCIIFKLQHLFPHLIQHYVYADFDYSKSQYVDHVRGSFFAFRRDVYEKIGGLDARYHIWFEEVDYCKRVREAGYRVWYSAEARANDYFGRGVAQMKRLETQRIFTKSMMRYFKKWYPSWQTALVSLARPFGLASALLLDIWNSWRSYFISRS